MGLGAITAGRHSGGDISGLNITSRGEGRDPSLTPLPEDMTKAPSHQSISCR